MIVSSLGDCMDNPPLEKGGEGGFKRNNATFQHEIFEDVQGILERIWWSL